MNRKVILCALCALMLSLCHLKAYAQNELSYVLSYLEQIDNGHLNQAWHESAESLKQELAKISFIKNIKTTKKELGFHLKRTFIKKKYATHLNGYPVSLYRIYTFKSQYQHSDKPIIEEVILSLDKGNTWRIRAIFLS